MLVITVSKKVAAIVAIAVVALIVGGVALAASRGGSSGGGTVSASGTETAQSPTAPSTSTCAPTPSAEVASLPTTAAARSTWVRSLPVPGASATPFQRAFYTTAIHPFAFDVTTTLASTIVSGSGASDLPAGTDRVQFTSGGSGTELVRIGDAIYVDAAQLGAPAPQWVQVDTSTQAAQLPARVLASTIDTLTPDAALVALAAPADLTLVGEELLGTHYRATVAMPNSAFVPMATVFDAIDRTSTVIDAWLDGSGYITTIAVPIAGATTEFSLHGFGDAVGVTAPGDVGGLDSPAGVFLFADGFNRPLQTSTVHEVTVAPVVSLDDVIITGDLHASSATGDDLRSTFLGSTSGGKLNIGDGAGLSGSQYQRFSVLPYATWLEGGTKANESFVVRVGEVTAADHYLLDLPLFGTLASPVIDRLQDDPDLSYQLADVIGVRALAQMSVDVAAFAPGNTPIAFTQKVTSFDGTQISANFFPVSTLAAGQTAPLVLSAAGLGQRGTIDPFATSGSERVVPGPGVLRTPVLGSSGFNVITWDPRGTFDSGGVLQFDNPFFEARDVSALLDWAAASTPTTLNGPNDPAVGMVGGSYGGGIQLTVAGTEPRIDAIVPVDAWHSLPGSLQAGNALDTKAAFTLLAALDRPEIRMSRTLRSALVDGLVNGRLSDADVAVLSNSNVLLNQLQAPALLIQDTNDPVWSLDQSLQNTQTILTNPYGVPTKLAWYDGTSNDPNVEQTLHQYSLAWLQKYVEGVPIPDALTPNFQWWDQTGTRYTSNLYPFSSGFNGATLHATPISGALTRDSAPLTTSITLSPGYQVVGVPTVTFSYAGTGSAHAVYARLVDTTTGHVLGDGPDAIPVVLDGQPHTVSMVLDAIAYTTPGAGGQIRLELFGSVSDFFTRWTTSVSITGLTFDLAIVD